MRNTWKGLIVGALTGAGVGLVLDGLNTSGRVARELAEQGSEKLADADLGDRAQHAASHLAESVRSDVAPAAKDAIKSTTQAVRQEVGPKVDAATKAVQAKVRR